MKGIHEQTYYEILEVSPGATAKEIQKAYEHAKETFHIDSLAIYSLFTEQEVQEIQVVIEEAYRALMEEAMRKGYDPSPIQPLKPQLLRSPSERGIPSREKRAPCSDLSLPGREEIYRGKRLKEIRERMRIDLETIAQETKISLRTLESIEEGDLEKLPALVYLKGFLKGYARSLGLDPHQVVEDYLRFLEGEKKKRPP